MHRRMMLSGVTGTVTVGVAGCLSGRRDSNGGSDGDSSDGGLTVDTSSARAVGRAAIEALIAGNKSRARALAPLEYVDKGKAGGMLLGDFEDEWTVVIDEIEALELEARYDQESLYNEATYAVSEEIDDYSGFDYQLEYVHGSETTAAPVVVYGLEINDEWYAWVAGSTIVRTGASVERDGNTVRLTDRGRSDGVFVLGHETDDPTEYHLAAEGETVTIQYDRDATDRVEFDVVAYAGDDPMTPDATRVIDSLQFP